MRLLAIALLVAAAAAPATASADRFVDPGGPTFFSVGEEMVVFDGFVYFAANNGVLGNELWRTDGTAAGTTLVKDFYTGTAGNHGNPSRFRVVGDRLYFNVQNDGTDDGSLLVYYLEPGGSPQRTQLEGGGVATGTMLGAVGGTVLLRQLENDNSNYGLYALKATESEFTKINDGLDSISPEPAAILEGKAYFGSASGPNSAYELWVTDGTEEGTGLFKNIRPDEGGNFGSDPRDFVATTERVYFTADDGNTGRELYATDGTADGTGVVYEHHEAITGTSFNVGAVAQGDTLYYLPDDPGTGAEVWRTQGPGTTRPVKDITPGPSGSVTTLFAFKDGIGFLRSGTIYFSDGTEAGTTPLGEVDGDGYGPAYPLAVGERAYFRGGFSPFGGAVWRTDGTPEGTFALTAGPFEGSSSGAPMTGPFIQLGTRVIFTAHYPHAEGDSIPASARRIYVIDTAQPDEVRQATVAPSIAGTPTVGQKLTGNRGTWTREPNEYTYEWLRNGAPIPNVGGTEYTLQTADAGTRISFRVTAGGTGRPNLVTAESAAVTVAPAPTSPGTSPPPIVQVTVPPTIPGPTPPATERTLTVRRAAKLAGVARVGKRLKLRKPALADSGVKLKIRWYANGKRIKKQTKSSLKLTKALRGKRISVRITATKAGFKTRTLTVGPTKKVGPRRR